jgi:hypothetical protein
MSASGASRHFPTLRSFVGIGEQRIQVRRERKCRQSRHCEPTGQREALPDDRLREAIH